MTSSEQSSEGAFPIEVLEQGATGRWQVTTESGAEYDFDLRDSGESHVRRRDAAGKTSRPVDWRLLYLWLPHRAFLREDRSLRLGDRMVLVMEAVVAGASCSVIVSTAITRISWWREHERRAAVRQQEQPSATCRSRTSAGQTAKPKRALVAVGLAAGVVPGGLAPSREDGVRRCRERRPVELAW